MDFFALPDVFLRKLMRTMWVKDRLRLRLTCRAFEQLVADTHAGHFDTAFVSYFTPNKFEMVLGDALFFGIDMTPAGLEQRQRLRDRLFSGISIGHCDFIVQENVVAIRFIRNLIKQMKIQSLGFRVESYEQLGNALTLFADFPRSKYSVELCFLPRTYELFSLPPMENIDILNGDDEISMNSLFKLLNAHKNLDLAQMTFTSEDLKKTMQVLSADTRQRKLKMKVDCTSMIKCLEDYGISKTTQAGEFCDDFEVVLVKKTRCMPQTDIHLRFKKCFIRLRRVKWEGSDRNVDVYISNCEEK